MVLTRGTLGSYVHVRVAYMRVMDNVCGEKNSGRISETFGVPSAAEGSILPNIADRDSDTCTSNFRNQCILQNSLDSDSM